LKARKYASIIRDLKIMHLKKELPQAPLNWINCDDEPRRIMQHPIVNNDQLLTYGLMKNVQKLLSEVRTDLDSFNDMEAYALMYSGYRQTMTSFKKDIDKYQTNWNFLQIENYCVEPAMQQPLIDVLKISASVPFKLVRKVKWLKWVLSLIGLVLAFFIVKFFIAKWSDDIGPFIKYGAVALFLLTFIVGMFSKTIAKLLDIEGFIKKILLFLALISVVWLIFNVYIIFFNPWYNRIGRMRRKVAVPNNG
jgi:hypothetical protein